MKITPSLRSVSFPYSLWENMPFPWPVVAFSSWALCKSKAQDYAWPLELHNAQYLASQNLYRAFPWLKNVPWPLNYAVSPSIFPS